MNKIKETSKYRITTNIGFGITLVAIFVIYTLLEWAFPIMYDDWAFMAMWKSHSPSGNFSLSAWLEFYDNIRNYHNGRLANALTPFSTVISPWNSLFPIFTGIAVAVVICLAERFASFNKRSNNFLFLTLCWFLLLILLPWRDSIFVADYALNYIFSAAVTLLFIAYLIRCEYKGWNPYLFVFAIPFAIVAGIWHEGFSITACVGFGVFILVKRFRISWQFYAVFFLYLISALFCLCAPGMMSRVSNVVSDTRNQLGYLYLLKRHLALIILSISFLGLLLFKKGRITLKKTYRNPFIQIGVGIIISGYAISLMPNQPLRSTFWPSLFCVINFIAFLINFNFTKSLQKKHKPISLVVSVVILGACVSQGILSIHWTLKYRRQQDEIMREFYSNNIGSPVYYDLQDPDATPSLTLGIPPKNINQPFNYYCMWLYFHSDFFSVLPKNIESIDFNEGTAIGKERKYRVIDNMLFGPYRERQADDFIKSPRHVSGIFIYDDGHEEEKIIVENPFITKPYPVGNTIKSDTLMYYEVQPEYLQGLRDFEIKQTIEI